MKTETKTLIQEVIGIDVGRATLECCGYHSGECHVFDNTVEGIEAMAGWALRSSKVKKRNLLFVFEYTDLYARRLRAWLKKKEYVFHVVSGLALKRSLDVTPGKSDKVDAKAIASYGYQLRGALEVYQAQAQTLESLKYLKALRKKLIAERSSHITALSEQQKVLDKKNNEVLFGVRQQVIAVYDQQIALIEQEFENFIP